MTNSYYGSFTQTKISSDLDTICEDIQVKGYHVVERLLDAGLCETLNEKIHALNSSQNEKFGAQKLITMGEDNLLRLPLTQDRIFFDKVIMNPQLQGILKRLFEPCRSFHVLNQQNVIINTGDKKHNQSSWHRDFPFLNGVLSIPAAYSVLVSIDEFTVANGGTRLVPSTHALETLPSWDFVEKNTHQVTCPRGSAIIFNAQLFHSAGMNTTTQKRVAINNIFTNPIFRQQISIPDALEHAGATWVNDLSDDERQILGYASLSPKSDEDFKNTRWKKFEGKA